MKNTIALLIIPVLAMGCTHTLRITKAPVTPSAFPKPDRPVRLALTSVGADPMSEALIKAVRKDPSIADLKEDYRPSGDFRPDYLCQLNQVTKFSASGQNFLVTYPGFIVFTHAWAGYRYKADVTTQATLMDANSNVVSQVAIQTPYEFRHCSFERGAAASCCGWLLPGYGAAAIIPGIIFASSYDKRATDEFLKQAAPSYGTYVASKLIEQLSLAQSNCASNVAMVNWPTAAAVTAPVVVLPDTSSAPDAPVFATLDNGEAVGASDAASGPLRACTRQALEFLNAAKLAGSQAEAHAWVEAQPL